MPVLEGWRSDPRRVRAAVALGGLLVLLALAGVMLLRRADPVEVWATLLFLPVFLAVVLWRLPGGLVGGVAASAVYVWMRVPAVEAAGLDPYLGVLAGRSLSYLAFGGIGGWAMSRLNRSLAKLDLYDQIDDATGLYNARFLVQGIELELARARRYQTIFSVVVLDAATAAVGALSPRRRARALRHIGQQIAGAIRSVDRGAHLQDARRHRFVLILPETPEEGARVFAERFRSQIAAILDSHGIALPEHDLELTRFTVPGDEERLAQLRAEAQALVPATAPADQPQADGDPAPA